MRALGDSKSALYFLMISSVLNIGGDLFFVEVLGWGSEGCALSTVLSEALCCVLCVVYIQFKVPVLQLGRRWFVFDSSLLRSTVQYGWTSAMQQATVQLGKIAVQAIVNTLGINAIGRFHRRQPGGRLHLYAQQNIAHAMTTLMAQNTVPAKGAGASGLFLRPAHRAHLRFLPDGRLPALRPAPSSPSSWMTPPSSTWRQSSCGAPPSST